MLHRGRDNEDMSPTFSFTPGTVVLGRYRLLELAGRGGCGETWRATPTSGGPDVALKVVDRGARADVLLHEAATLHGLNHPNIVRFLGYVELPDERETWLILEWVGGGTLHGWMRRRERSAAAVAPLLAQITEAVAWLHERGVVHRDLKPSNVLLDLDGRRVKLADFGLAGGRGLGSRGFVAPEILLGRPSGPAADLYALGALSWTMLHGADPAAMTGNPCPGPEALMGCIEAGRSSQDRRLIALAMELMDPDPRRRPPLFAVQERLRGLRTAPLWSANTTPSAVRRPA